MNVWRNKKTGDLYEVVNYNVTDATNGTQELPHVLYRNAGGNYYVRQRSEFYDKFEKTDLPSIYLAPELATGAAKMVIVVRTDIKMPVGKIAAQAAHAAMSAFMKNGKWVSDGAYVINAMTDADRAWFRHKFTKIVLACDGLDEMRSLQQKADAAGLKTSLIIDAGDTVFGGVPTETCLAIGPDWPSRIDEITGHLKLLK